MFVVSDSHRLRRNQANVIVKDFIGGMIFRPGQPKFLFGAFNIQKIISRRSDCQKPFRQFEPLRFAQARLDFARGNL
jgi:hypothetical protein